jgi:hypothetical protein
MTFFLPTRGLAPNNTHNNAGKLLPPKVSINIEETAASTNDHCEIVNVLVSERLLDVFYLVLTLRLLCPHWILPYSGSYPFF